LRAASAIHSVRAVTPRRRIPPWALLSTAWILPALLGAVDTFAQIAMSGDRMNYREVAFSFFDWLFYGVLTPFVVAISRRFPLAKPKLGRHAAVHVLCAILFCFAWAAGGVLLHVLLGRGFGAGVLRWYAGWVFTTFPFGSAVYFSVVGMEHALRYFVEARERDAQVARLSEQLTGARLAALQAQLNPHFLFNSLNTVNVLVRDGENATATRVIEQLSEVLRTSLSRSRDNEVSLDDELELVRQYLAVEQARFSDRLRPEIDVPDHLLSAAVPSFAIQHLVENAVRHGIARRSDAGRITVAARRAGAFLEVTVADDGPGLRDEPPSPGHGLDNTRERLRTLYGAAASLDLETTTPFGAVARLRIPYRELVLREARRDGE
jgi:two-component system LytT family sensor kinase